MKNPGWTSKYYRMVPKDQAALCLFRLSVLRRCHLDKSFRADMIRICKVDILFWINVFGWLFEPRVKPGANTSTVIPFNTFQFQDDAILAFRDCFGIKDVLVEKSREEGVTWIDRYVDFWFWLFYPTSILVASYKEEYVEKGKGGQPKSIFWKHDFILDHLPVWMQPPIDTRIKYRKNLITGGHIEGEATTADFGSGNRVQKISLDEFAKWPQGVDQNCWAATRDVSNSRFVISTPRGTANQFYRIKTRSAIQVIRIHWTQDPRKNKGLYTSDASHRLKILDVNFKFPPKYPFILDGRVRSPWYDVQWYRRENDWEIAQELDISYEGSCSRPIGQEVIDRLVAETARPPLLKGTLNYEPDTASPTTFETYEHGFLHLWFGPDPGGNPPKDQVYGIGVDIATGTGASNSAIVIVSMTTGEQMAEFVTPRMDPVELSFVAQAIGHWFYDAVICYDAKGPGRNFGKRLIERQYPNIYKRKLHTRGSPANLELLYGWDAGSGHGESNFKRQLLEEFFDDLKTGKLILRSTHTLHEAGRFVFTAAGIEHENSLAEADPSGAKANHGDRATGAALANLLRRAGRGVAAKDVKKAYPENSVGGRLEKAMRQHRAERPKSQQAMLRSIRRSGRSSRVA